VTDQVSYFRFTDQYVVWISNFPRVQLSLHTSS
jgi:hypothetical protein